MVDAYIGLGGNIGNPLQAMADALDALSQLPGTSVVAVSHVYASRPWGESDQPPYANAVARLRTTLLADQLLGYLLDIESSLGRRRGSRYGPRTIDLDLLLFGDEEWQTKELTIPHPRMRERDFVLTPLLAIAPDAHWPDGTPVVRTGELVGEVIADHGRLPDSNPDWYYWEAFGREHAEPLPEGERAPWDPGEPWVEVASASAVGGALAVLEGKLRAANIPYQLSHREFGDAIGSLSGPSSIFVPRAFAPDARLFLAIRVETDVPVPLYPEEEPPERPAWFRATLTVFGWLFAIYWISRVLNS